jgi:hypothetical protein
MVKANGPFEKPDKYAQFSNGLVLGYPVPAEIDYLNNKLVRYSDDTVFEFK